MLLSTVISLYTSRLILQILGVSDYGVYGVVAGVVTMFGFFNGSMAGTTARFLSYEIGIGNSQRLKDTFSSALMLHFAIAIVVVILCETIGLWFLEYKLVIPDGRMYAAQYCLQFSIFTLFFQVIQVPFNATIISHERMDYYAYVEIANSTLKLLIVYVLLIGNLDKLILYSILTFGVSIITAIAYITYGIFNFNECSLKIVWRKEILKPMLNFSGLEFYGNMSIMAITQGVNMLLNMWFGTIMNAAYDIATRVKSIIMSLSTNVSTAIRPQIVKTYSAKEFDRMFVLMCNSTRITFLFMLILCAPFIAEAHYVLLLWLGIVPEHSETLLQLSLVWNIFVSLTVGMADVARATGDVKNLNIVPGTMYLSIFPITYIAYRMGAPYWFPFALNVVAVSVSPIYTCWNFKKYLPGFSWQKHVFVEMAKCCAIMMVVIFVTYLFTLQMNESFLRLVLSVIISSILTCSLGFYWLFPKEIRAKFTTIIKSKVFK